MIKIIALLISTLLLWGCALHEPVQIELPQTPENYLHDREMQTLAASDGKWWLAFHDNKLDALMTELFAANLDVSQMIARLQQAEALVSVSQSARIPSLTAAGNISRSNQPGLLGDFKGDSSQMSAQAGYELDLWGKLRARTQAAGLDYAATRQELQALFISLSARLADLYFYAAEQRSQIALADQLIASFKDTSERVERRYRFGLTGVVDLYQSRQSLSAAQASRNVYEAGLAEAEHAISVLLGRYPEQRQDMTPDMLPDPPALFPVGIPADLISRRPDIRAAFKRVEAADKRVAAAIAERFPNISFSGNLGTLRQEVTGGLITGDFWSLLGNIALPVIDGGRRRAEVRRNKAVLAEAVAAYQQKVLLAFQEVEDALANNYSHAKRINRLRETTLATGATLRLSTERYLAGLTDYLPVLSAQRADFDASSRLLTARRQLLSDRVSLARALGGSWMIDEVNKRLQTEKDAGE